MDDLKKYLREQRDALDVDAPSDAVWERIAQQQPAGKSKVIPMMIRFAAAACIIAFIAGGIFYITQNHTTPQIKDVAVEENKTNENTLPLIIQPKNIIDTGSVNEGRSSDYIATNKNHISAPAKKDVRIKNIAPAGPSQDEMIVEGLQSNYAQLVSMQVSRLNKMPLYAVSPGYFSGFKDQLKMLDRSESSLRSEIKKYGLNDELLQQLININQQKLNVLKTLQSEISKINNRVIGNKPQQDTLQASYLNI